MPPDTKEPKSITPTSTDPRPRSPTSVDPAKGNELLARLFRSRPLPIVREESPTELETSKPLEPEDPRIRTSFDPNAPETEEDGYRARALEIARFKHQNSQFRK